MAGAGIGSERKLERRLAQRHRVGPQDFVVHTGTSWRIRDLSAGGVFIEDREPLPEGEAVFLELHLGNERLSCQGIVRRSVPGQGMGVQFRAMPLETRNSLERYLNTIQKHQLSTQNQVTAPANTALGDSIPASTPGVTTESDGDLTARLQNTTAQLKELMQALKPGQTDPRVLRDFRDAVDFVRLTTWAIQQWSELQAQNRDAYDVLPLLTKERIRRAAQLAEDLALDIDATEVSLTTEGLSELYKSVGRLHQRLARIFKN